MRCLERDVLSECLDTGRYGLSWVNSLDVGLSVLDDCNNVHFIRCSTKSAEWDSDFEEISGCCSQVSVDSICGQGACAPSKESIGVEVHVGVACSPEEEVCLNR